MESPSDKPFDEDAGYVPLSIKLIIVWFYFLALLGFFDSVSFRSGLFNFNVTSFVIACLSLMTAYGLGSKRNISRVVAITLAGLWSLPIIQLGLQALKFWQETSRIAEFSIYFFGKEFTGGAVIAVVGSVIAIQIYTVVTLLQPQTRKLFVKPSKMGAAE